MKRIEMIMVVGILALLLLGYGLTTTYAHQYNAVNNTDDAGDEHDYDECPMYEEHYEEMEAHHSQMMGQWNSQYGPGYGMGMGGC